MNSEVDLQTRRSQLVQEVQSIDDELLRRSNEKIQNVRDYISQNLSVEEQKKLWKQPIPGAPIEFSPDEFDQWLKPASNAPN